MRAWFPSILLRLLVCCGPLFGCSAGGAPEPAAPRTPRFAVVASAPQAWQVDGRLQRVALGGLDEAQALVQDAGDSQRWTVRVPNGGDPELDVMLLALGPADSTVVARLEIFASGEATSSVGFRRLLRASVPAQGELRRLPLRLSLERFAGQEVEFLFEAQAASEGVEGGRVAWVHPRVLARVEAARPPVIMICVDTLRRDHVDPYVERGLTPRIAELARDSIRFQRAIASSSWTLPSVASVMTGLDAQEHRAGRRVTVKTGATQEEYQSYRDAEQGFVRFYKGEIFRVARLHPDVETLAERLAPHYVTHAVNSNISLTHVGNVLTQGFASTTYRSTLSGDAVTRRSLRWLSKRRDDRVFLYSHYIEPHEWPYRSLREGQVPEVAQVYQTAYVRLVRKVDRQVGDLLEGLKALGFYDDSLIVLFSDHGEHFWDDVTGKRSMHGNTMHDLLIGVPLFVKLPGSEYAGQIVEVPVKLADLYATVLEEVGLRGQREPAGLLSLREVLADPSREQPRLIASEHNARDSELVAVQRGDYKLIHDLYSGEFQLRDAMSDRVLTDPQGAQRTEYDELRAIVAKRIAERVAVDESEAILVSPKELENLRALGYVD